MIEAGFDFEMEFELEDAVTDAFKVRLNADRLMVDGSKFYGAKAYKDAKCTTGD